MTFYYFHLSLKTGLVRTIVNPSCCPYLMVSTCVSNHCLLLSSIRFSSSSFPPCLFMSSLSWPDDCALSKSAVFTLLRSAIITILPISYSASYLSCVLWVGPCCTLQSLTGCLAKCVYIYICTHNLTRVKDVWSHPVSKNFSAQNIIRKNVSCQL